MEKGNKSVTKDTSIGEDGGRRQCVGLLGHSDNTKESAVYAYLNYSPSEPLDSIALRLDTLFR